MLLTALVVVTIRGLSVGKWVHKAGGVLMLATFAMLLVLPWLNVAHGSLAAVPSARDRDAGAVDHEPEHRGKMGFGALGGFEYVAIHAGECRNPVRTIARSVALAAPIIAVMFILGTSSVLALVPIESIDLIAPIPQVLSVGLRRAGLRGRRRAGDDPRPAVHPRRAGERDVRGQHAAADGGRLGRPAAGVVHAPAPALPDAGQLDPVRRRGDARVQHRRA